MDLLRIDVGLQKPAQERSGSRSRGGPLARLGVDPRDELVERIIRRTDFPQLVGDLSQELLRGAAAVVFDIGQMSCRDADIRRESAEGESGMKPEPSYFLAEVCWGQGTSR